MACQTCNARRYTLASAEADVQRLARRMARDDSSPRLRALLERALLDRDNARRYAAHHRIYECEAAA